MMRSSVSMLCRTATSRLRLSKAHSGTSRLLSSQPSGTNAPLVANPPTEINDEMAMGIQDATSLYVKWGIAKQRLEEIRDKPQAASLVIRWQKMMEAFLGTQVHVLAGLGYSPDEQGLALYNSQLGQYVMSASPEIQEQLRVKGRDTWRQVLTSAFNVELDEMKELSIADARNMMHQVSLKMQQEEVLEAVAKQCALIKPSDIPQVDMAKKHQVIQEVLVTEVYLGGSPSLVEQCGFDPGEEGYVYMQCVMAEHQHDPLVAQYIGTSMMKIMQAAGLDLSGTGAKV